MKTPLIVLLAIVLAACSGGGSSTSSSATSTDATSSLGTAVISDYFIDGDEITIAWDKSTGADADSWSIYHNASAICNNELSVSSDDQQSGSCSFTLVDGSNSIYVQLCSADTCTSSETLEIEHNLPPGAIYLDSLPNETGAKQLEVKWIKEQGANGDLWYIYHNTQSACSGSLTMPTEQQAQSAGCSIKFDFGEHQFQARLCVNKPTGTADICTDSPVHSLNSYFDPGLELATPVIEALDTQLPAWETSINWSKDNQNGSAGESWIFYHNNSLACSGTLGANDSSGICSLELQEGNNSMYVQLCTEVETYSGAKCTESAIVEVEGTYPYALDPGEISLSTVFITHTYEQSLIIDWLINSGNGVTEWQVQLNDSTECLTTSSDYLSSGSCSVDLALGANSISVIGCNHGMDGNSSCSQSPISSTERLQLPGAPEITSPTETSTYVAEQSLSWERSTGASAESWFASLNGTDECWDTELAAGEVQSGECEITLASGNNELQVRLCSLDSVGASYCSYSSIHSIELLAATPGQAAISTESQTLYDDEITIEWSNSGIAASSWYLSNNGLEVGECGPNIPSSTSPQSGSCLVSLSLGDNLIAVTLCNTNAAGRQSCSASETVTIDRQLDSPEFTSSSSITVDEHSTGIIYTPEVQDNDSSAEQLSFALLEADDHAAFSLDPSSGAITTLIDLDYESPQDSDQNNVYQLQLEVYDDSDGSDSLSLQIAISNLNDNPPIFTNANPEPIPVAENTSAGTTIYTASATDLDGDALVYSLGGADSAYFDLNPESAQLSFKQAPDFEDPQDSNQDNTYELEISASDAATSISLELNVSLSDSNDEFPQVPSPTASTAHDISEITLETVIYTVEASDADAGDILTYSLGGIDADQFNLDSTSGELRFTTLPSLSEPQDADQNNVYDLELSVSDAAANSTSLALEVTVADDIGSAPEFSAESASVEFADNKDDLLVYDAEATDPDDDTITYSLGGTDVNFFNIDAASGAVSFKAAPAYQEPLDSDNDNNYHLTIFARDTLGNQAQLDLSVLVTSANAKPTFTNANPGTISIPENTSTDTTIYTASATDAEDEALTYTLGGIDQAYFELNSETAQLSFNQAPDFEDPQDSNQDNTYELAISVTDNTHSTSVDLNVSVSNINEAHYFASTSSSLSLNENDTSSLTLPAAIDPDASNAISYELLAIAEDNNDYQYFNLTQPENSTAPSIAFADPAVTDPAGADYENASDHNRDHTYEFILHASDDDYSASIDINVTITNLNDETPQFTSATTEAIDYSDIVLGATVYTATSTDADANDQIAYTLGGADQQHFALDSSSGALAFSELPSLVNPKDANTDNTYELTITATDLGANSSELALSISVIDTGSAPTFASASASISVDENTISTIYTAQATDADGDILTYSLTGADAEHFTIDPSIGDLAFTSAPDYENPTDQGTDNIYDLAIVATDSVGKQAQQDLTISVNNLNDNQPAFNLSSNSFDVPESSTAVATIAASDADGDELSFALITTSDDSSHFTLDPASGDLSFNQAPDFEKPQDANTDNTYELELSVSDGSHTTSQAIAIKVTDVDGEPYFHSTADYVDSIFEGTEAPFLVLHIQAADAEDDADKKILYFTISGGDDADKFILNAVDRNSANLSFNLSPDFENPQDFDLDNNYSVTLQVEDTDENTAQHDFIVAVQDVNDEAPRLTSASSAEVNENSTEVFYIATAEDGDGSGESLTFSLDSTNYPHHSTLFSINSSSGELKAANGLDYEHLLSSTQSNYYTIGIKVTDQAGNSSTSPLTITVIDDPDDAHPAAESGPQIPWFYSDSSGREHIRIPWVIYVGDGAIEWEMSVNGELKCSVYSGLSSPLSSGTCAVPTSEFTIGSIDNTAQVSVLYPDGSRGSSKTITFGYAVPEAEGYYPEQSMDTIHDTPRLGFPSDCADVKIGEPVNHDSHDDCYDYLLYDHSFGGRFDDVPSYLWSGKYGRSFDVIAYFIEWGVYARDFDAHDLRANWLSTALYSFIKFEGDNTTADDECENCTFSGAVAIADPWAAFDKPFYMPGEEEKYADEANNEEELAEILADKAEMTGKGIFQQFWLLKQKFPHLKTCLSVGGWSFSRPFPLVASDPDKRATFAQSIVDMAVEYHFDCIDIDWEFPGKAGGDRVATHNGVATYDLDGDGISPFVDPSEADADYYVDLVATLRGEIVSRPEAAHIEINSAVYTSSEGMALMDYGAFADDLDGIHMMTYDYYGAWDPHTGLQAALYANTNPVSDDVALAYGNPYNPEHNIASAMARGVNNAIYNGFGQEIAAVDPGSATSSDVSQATLANVGIRQKIVPGLAFYGRNYSGVNMDTPDRGKYMVRATGTTGESDGSAEQLGWEPGNLNYVQLKGFYFHGDTVEGNDYYYADGYSTAGREWTYYWDDESQTPFLYDADTGSFVSYTDPRAIFYQTCHAAWHNSKGVMFWEASGDSGGNDLLMFIHLALKEYLVESGGRPYAICEDLKGIYQRDDVVYSDGSDGGGNDSDDGELDLAGYGLDELVDLGHFSEDIFSNFMFPWRNGDPSVSDGSETYTWDGFAKAADHFADFGFLNEGSIEDRLRELAAFFANSSQETHNSHGVYALINKDGIIGQGRYNAGYYYQQEQACAVGGADYGQDICSYCDASDTAYGVACDWLYENGSAKADDFYYGRGPMQLRWNYHYGAFGEYYYQDSDLLLYNPNMLVQDSEAAFASAIWYWMTERDGKPSAHDVMTLGNYSYDPESESSERYPGFGMTINVTRGESECGAAYDHDANRNRIGFYITYLNILEDHYDPGEGLSPWVGTNGSEPSKSHDFPTKVEDLISEHEDVEKYLSCKNMQNY